MKTTGNWFRSWKWKKALEKREDAERDPMGLMGQIRECEYLLRRNEQLFNMQGEDGLVDSLIYEREALRARYDYLIRAARQAGRAEEPAFPRQERVFPEKAFAE